MTRVFARISSIVLDGAVMLRDGSKMAFAVFAGVSASGNASGGVKKMRTGSHSGGSANLAADERHVPRTHLVTSKRHEAQYSPLKSH